MADAGVVRAAALLVPMAAVAALWAWRRPGRRLGAGVLLATVWNLPALLALHLIATAAGWWRYEAVGGLVLGMPVDLLLGWMLLWGAVPVLAFRGGLLAPLAAMLLLDAVLMPLAAPVVVLGERWLIGEFAGLGLSLVPALLLGRWTAQDRRLGARATLQVALTGGLLFWLLPLLALGTPSGMLSAFTAAPAVVRWAATAGLTLTALLGVAAVQEFAERGRGTPLPYDPPSHLVRSGPYAYLRNPMQTSVTVALAVSAAAALSARLALAAVVATAYGVGLAWWHEQQELPDRFGEDWHAYRGQARAWWPAPRPATGRAPGVLWVAMSCAQCCPVAEFFISRRPTALTVLPAEGYPGPPLRRITYEADGRRWQGVAAVARALEHVHLGWAVAGWCLRLPGVQQAVQVLTDAAGGGPRDLPALSPAGSAAACESPRA